MPSARIRGSQGSDRSIVATAAAEWPMFDRLKPYIRTAIEQHKGPLTPNALERAYIRAFKEHGGPLDTAWLELPVSDDQRHLIEDGLTRRNSAAQIAAALETS